MCGGFITLSFVPGYWYQLWGGLDDDRNTQMYSIKLVLAQSADMIQAS